MATAQPSPDFDPGFTQRYQGSLLRAINKDGSFNIRRRGVPFEVILGSAYQGLVGMRWPKFLSLVLLGYLAVNTLFAGLYWLLGPEAVHASDPAITLGSFARAFFFSVQTLTTVGYGHLYPTGMGANVLAAVEAALGLMGFALATGLLFARFSRPNARLAFSNSMIVAPYRGGTGLQFRIANQRSNVLMEVDAMMMLMTVEQGPNGEMRRNFAELRLERRNIFFLALTWTIVHPIDESSPLWGLSAQDLEREQAEIMILIKGFDDSFRQVVHRRYSYRWDEIEWDAQFEPAFDVSEEGHMVLDIGRVSGTVKPGPAVPPLHAADR